MSATIALESNEDLENVALVRMEDVQPDRSMEVLNLSQRIVGKIDDKYILNVEDDSGVANMVWIKPEDVVWKDDSEQSSKLIVLDKDPSPFQEWKPKAKELDSWPTLEILPGGVIKNVAKCEYNLTTSNHSLIDDDKEEAGMYVCAKCSESFHSLVLLQKHVRCHEEKRKRETERNRLKFSSRTCKTKYILKLKKCKKPKKS